VSATLNMGLETAAGVLLPTGLGTSVGAGLVILDTLAILTPVN